MVTNPTWESPLRARSLTGRLQNIEEQEEATFDDANSWNGTEKRRRPRTEAFWTEENGKQESASPMVTMVLEDSYLPTPFIVTLQELIGLAQKVLDTDLDQLLENPGACAESVYNIQALGIQWERNPEWPCREWFIRLLLGVAALNRVVEWWEVEHSFWSAEGTTAVGTASDTDATDRDSIISEASKPDEGDYYTDPQRLRRTSETESSWSFNESGGGVDSAADPSYLRHDSLSTREGSINITYGT